MKFLYYGTLYKMERLRTISANLLSKHESNGILSHRFFKDIPGEEKAKIFIKRVQDLESDKASSERTLQVRIDKLENACRQATEHLNIVYKYTIEGIAKKSDCRDRDFRSPLLKDFECIQRPLTRTNFGRGSPPDGCVIQYIDMLSGIQSTIKMSARTIDPPETIPSTIDSKCSKTSK